MLFLEQDRAQWRGQPAEILGGNVLTFSEQQYFVRGNASQSKKRQGMLEIWGTMAPLLSTWLRLCPRVTHMVHADDLVPSGTTLVTPVLQSHRAHLGVDRAFSSTGLPLLCCRCASHARVDIKLGCRAVQFTTIDKCKVDACFEFVASINSWRFGRGCFVMRV